MSPARNLIRNALALHNHSSRLIELTTVSKLWQSFLCSTPVLWSELVIDEKQEDFLAMLSVFVALSGEVALKLTFPRIPVDWTGLASLLLPVIQRITCLGFEVHSSTSNSWILPVIPTVFGCLGQLLDLKEVDFDTFIWEGDSFLQTVSSLLPSTVKVKGKFLIAMPEGCQNSGTPGRFFDIVKYNTFSTSEPITPSSNSSILRYPVALSNRINIICNNATVAQLESLAGRLAERKCFEQTVYWTARHLQDLQIVVHLSQVQDAIDCLRLLKRLQTLEFNIEIEDNEETINLDPNNASCHELKVFSMFFRGDDVREISLWAQRTLCNLFSAFQILYPSVEELSLHANTWPFFASSYLQSLRALKLLSLTLTGSICDPPKESINLQSLQCLVIDDLAYLDNLHMPNLLKLTLNLRDLDM